MADKNRTCLLCGKKYKYCYNCGAERTKPAWHNIFCSEECVKVNRVLAAYDFEQIDKAEAHKRLIDMDYKERPLNTEELTARVKELLDYKPATKNVSAENQAKSKEIVK